MNRNNDRPRVRLKAEHCQHDYRWIETVRGSRETGDPSAGLVEYELVDRFYCKYCLDIQTRSQKAVMDKFKDMPGWF